MDPPAQQQTAAPEEAATSETAAPAEAPASPVDQSDTAPPADVAAPAPQEEAAAPQGDDNAIVVTARLKAPPGDPLVRINEQSFQVMQGVDDALVAPIAMTYKSVLPEPARDGLRNFLRNLTEPVNFVNFLLQFKIGKAVETAGRFAVNSTAGVAGLVDVARRKPINLPYRANGFANTMGYYGIGPGPFFFVPIIGPTTLRDLFGWVLDKGFLPTLAGSPFNKPAYALSSGVIKSLNDRIEFDEQLKEFRKADDPYASEREYYLNQRKAEIEALHHRKAKPIEVPDNPSVAAPAPAPAAAAPAPPQAEPEPQPQPEPQPELLPQA